MDTALYWLGIRVYVLMVRIASLFNPKAKLFITGRKGLLRQIKYALINERRPRIWMHCASLGEFEQGRPVLEELRSQYPDFAFVLTFFSPSGYEVRKNYEGADYIFYLPVDSRKSARLFLDAVQPKLCLFVKYDFWYYFLAAIAKRNINAILISAIFRREQGFFKWYGGLQRRMLFAFSHIFVQDTASERLLQKVNYEAVSVSGDTRFDRVMAAIKTQTELPVAAQFCADKKILVAGSTWPEDERVLQKAFEQMPEDWKLIIVPHEVHESHIADIEKLFGNDAAKWSSWTANDRNKKVLIVDTVGLLLQLYRSGDVAWIGGGFGKAGVHNVLEAAVYGMPCFYGPVYHQFLEAKALIEAGGAIVAGHPEILVEHIRLWQKEPALYKQAADAAAAYVAGQAGATPRILRYLAEKNCIRTV
jgi:3-deoxy-D-manno-octulosonic-acid transferase